MSPRRKASSLPSDPLWYKDAIVYEVPVRAFYDADGDGIGDFQGLIQKLDYVQDLGVTAIWILPFYPSPLRDGGYDIADYSEVNPAYGTLKDFVMFLDEAHKRGIRVITELVINHTSSDHPWFQRARRAPPGSKWRDFYVWSDTPERYTDARIIFQDFETSNWTWDPVAKAYYWHRFYSHQPDLNFDSPHVRKAIFHILDFWMGMGVDGLRLDAIPYLYEREGTNCENLPETHAFLRELRAYIDGRYQDRMLLAEANQWPEDAAAYFGNGDECHMNFHFPLMPRMFMSLLLESSFPILDILDQTPDIPDSCQWAIFLRNHDELTLEMVTDEDRDFMYRMYAEDPRARLNLGIRRRLAPLLGERRKIELMHALLFSMPGTPVLYYGDEIGMGDNIYLGDRDGVRTPMQWSAGRNAGFSSANPQKLYLPVIIDPEYHCEAINVEAHQNNGNSLLWWMKRIIALRKQHKVFSQGRFRVLHPRNNKVLAFLRHDDDERVLVVANLSRFSQPVELDLSEFRGMIPTELFGNVEFPKIDDRPYVLTLGPHGFFWLDLQPDEAVTDLDSRDLPRVVVQRDWTQVLEGRNRTRLERLLSQWIASRRWFRGKNRKRRLLRVQDVVDLRADDRVFRLCALRVEYIDNTSEVYVVPLGFVTGEEVRWQEGRSPGSIIARLAVAIEGEREEEGLLCDASVSTDFARALLNAMRRARRIRGRHGALRSNASRRLRSVDPRALEPRVAAVEQSNTSIMFDDEIMVKLFRVAEPGPHPEEEMGRFLTETARFQHIPAFLGSLTWEAKNAASVVAIAQDFVPSEGDAWRLSLDLVAHSYNRVLEGGVSAREVPRPTAPLVERCGLPIPQPARELLGAFHTLAQQMGLRIGQLHLALASDPDNPDFAPQPFSLHHQRALYQSARALLGRTWDRLEHVRGDLPEEVQGSVTWALEHRRVIDDRLKRIVGEKIAAQRIRCHGDLHLGQILHTGSDFVIIDFEGEPARPIAERRFKRCPIRDVAGMLRSFHYAAVSGLRDGRERPEDARALAPWARAWVDWASTALFTAWLEALDGSDLIPHDPRSLQRLLDFYLLEKCVYEVGYELDNRPSWLSIPLEGLRALLDENDSTEDSAP